MDATNVAYDIYDIYEWLADTGGQEYVLLTAPEPLDDTGASTVYDVGGLMEKTLEFFVQRLSEVFGAPAFYGGLANRRSPKWLEYELIAVWNHGGIQKYIAWRNVNQRATICVGRHTERSI